MSCRYFFLRKLSAACTNVSKDTVPERLNTEWAFSVQEKTRKSEFEESSVYKTLLLMHLLSGAKEENGLDLLRLKSIVR